MRPYDDFEPGEIMPWQEMSKLLRTLSETCSELLSIFGAEHSDIKTRLDDLEETLGDCLQQYKGDQENTIEVLSGNSGFEDAEMRRLEREPWDREKFELWS